jgi:hypothetical protein
MTFYTPLSLANASGQDNRGQAFKKLSTSTDLIVSYWLTARG